MECFICNKEIKKNDITLKRIVRHRMQNLLKIVHKLCVDNDIIGLTFEYKKWIEITRNKE